MDRRRLLALLGLTAASTVVAPKLAAARPGMPTPPPTEPKREETFAPPVGSIVAWAGRQGDQIMPNWMLCDGREVTRLHYRELFEVIGTFFGEGDHETTFNIPDMRPRLVVPDYTGRMYAGAEHHHTHMHSHGVVEHHGVWGTSGSVEGGHGHVHANVHNNVPPFQPTLAVQHLIKVLP